MKISIAALVLVAVGLASAKVEKNSLKNYLTKTNRIPKGRPSVVKEVAPENVGLDVCAECKSIAEKVESILQDQGKIAEVKMLMNLVCDMIPSPEEKEACKSLVANADAIIHELEPLLSDPAKFCSSIDLCGSGEASQVTKVLMVIAKYKVLQWEGQGAETSGALCDECKFAIGELKAVWDQKSIQDEVKNLLDQLCSSLGSYSETCVNLINTYFPLLVSEVDQLLADPTTTCGELGLCSSRTLIVRGQRTFPARPGKVSFHRSQKSEFVKLLNRMARVQTKEGASSGCSMCVFSIGALIESIKLDPALLKQWASGIQGICTKFPTGLQRGCNDFLSIYLEPVLLLTVESVSPKEVCTMFKACSTTSYEEIMEYKKMGSVSSGIACESCRMVSQFLKTELQQQDFQDKIKNEVKQICNFVPGQYAEQCEQMVEMYTPYLFNLLVTEIDPDTICPEIGLCTASARPKAVEIENAIDEAIGIEN